MAIVIKTSDLRVVRSKVKVSPTAFEESLPEGITMDTVTKVDTHRAEFLEAAIRTGAELVGDCLVGSDDVSGFNSATIVVPMGGTECNVVVKPHKDTGVLGVQVKADTVLTNGDKNGGILSGTDYLTQLVQKRLNASK